VLIVLDISSLKPIILAVLLVCDKMPVAVSKYTPVTNVAEVVDIGTHGNRDAAVTTP